MANCGISRTIEIDRETYWRRGRGRSEGRTSNWGVGKRCNIYIYPLRREIYIYMYKDDVNNQRKGWRKRKGTEPRKKQLCVTRSKVPDKISRGHPS